MTRFQDYQDAQEKLNKIIAELSLAEKGLRISVESDGVVLEIKSSETGAVYRIHLSKEQAMFLHKYITEIFSLD